MPTVKPSVSTLASIIAPVIASWAALAALGCGSPFRPVTLPRPISMSPLGDATLSVELGQVFVTRDILKSGMGEDSALAVVLGITNTGREPYTLNAGSMSCWMELSPDLPGETRSLTPAGGGEGDSPGSDLDDLQLGSATIPPGASRHYWVVFRGYRFEGSDAPRKVTVSLPDARGRRVQLVIADPALGDLRWATAPARTNAAYGVQNTSVFAPGFTTSEIAAEISLVSRVGPILYDLGLTSGMVHQSKGRMLSETSGFTSTGGNAHLTLPFATWGNWQDPRQFGIYGGVGLQLLIEIPDSMHDPKVPVQTYGVVSVEGGIELDVGAHGPPAASPFPISYSGRLLPRWTIRAGYTHWFIGGDKTDLNSGGYVSSVRFAW
jgi:hypothetical protein